MELTVTRHEAALVVGVRGRLDSTTSSRLEQELLSRIAAAERSIVLDCSQLAYITSAGLRAVLLTAKKLKNTQGALVLCSLNESVWKVFDLAGFTRILSIHATLQDALAGLPTR
jgi:anti-anti-sigma factor